MNTQATPIDKLPGPAANTPVGPQKPTAPQAVPAPVKQPVDGPSMAIKKRTDGDGDGAADRCSDNKTTWKGAILNTDVALLALVLALASLRDAERYVHLVPFVSDYARANQWSSIAFRVVALVGIFLALKWYVVPALCTN